VIETAVLVAPGNVVEVPGLPQEILAATPDAAPAPPTATLSATLPPMPVAESAGTSVTVAGPVTPESLALLTPEQRLEGFVMPLEEVERILVRNALQQAAGNREQAARLLGMSERTLYRKIKQWGAQVTE
jgi:DNA-binding NtrC family response regulator